MPSCVILQPSYIPWRGYFHQIVKADIFVFYDDVQYDKHGWRNRNRIKTPQGTRWLTIPVHSHAAQIEHIPINQIHIGWERPWHEEHWRTIEYAYHKAPFFSTYAPAIQDLYTDHPELLADFTIETTVRISQLLGIPRTRFVRSSSLAVEGRKTDRLVNILLLLEADHYISGPRRAIISSRTNLKQPALNLNLWNTIILNTHSSTRHTIPRFLSWICSSTLG